MNATQNKCRPKSVILVAIVCAMLISPAIVQVIIELIAGNRVSALDIFRQRPSEPSLRQYEEKLAERLVAASWARVRYAEVLDRLFQRGNAKVVFGVQEWLFLTDALRYLEAPGIRSVRDEEAPLAKKQHGGPVGAILDFDRQLAEAGVKLVVIPVPNKATIYPEKLADEMDPQSAPNNSDLHSVLAKLRASGVMVVELADVLLEAKGRGSEVYLPRDTHWSPLGARLAAHAVADRVVGLPELGTLSFRTAKFLHRRVRFTGRGDLVGMLAYGSRGVLFPPMEFEVLQVVEYPGGPAPTGDHGSPIVRLGDSFTGVFSDSALHMGRRGGFAEHLADALGMPLDVIAMPAGGPNRAREAFALRSEGTGDKRVVLWEFSERELLADTVPWRHVTLRSGEGAPTVEPSGPASVRARLAGISRVPERLDYADCLIILRYDIILVREGTVPEGPLFVAVWGQRQWEPAPATRDLNLGDVYDLSLIPIDERCDLERTCWTDDVGMDRAPWWAEVATSVSSSD